MPAWDELKAQRQAKITEFLLEPVTDGFWLDSINVLGHCALSGGGSVESQSSAASEASTFS
jgi:hypothetical protein